MNASELIAQCENLSPRKLDYWCRQGVFGIDKQVVERYRRRIFTEEDLRIAHIISQVSAAFSGWSGGRGGYVSMYCQIADQMRAGSDPVHIVMADGIDIHIAVGQIAPASEPAETSDVPVEMGFIPGIGVDNA